MKQPPVQPSPPPGEEKRGQVSMEGLKEKLVKALKEHCGWIADVNALHDRLRSVPEDWVHSPTYSRYAFYGYLVFGDSWTHDPEFVKEFTLK